MSGGTILGGTLYTMTPSHSGLGTRTVQFERRSDLSECFFCKFLAQSQAANIKLALIVPSPSTEGKGEGGEWRRKGPLFC